MIRAVFLALVLVCLLAFASPAFAINDPAEALKDPAAEARAVEVGRQLRCLVCQNESIEDSGADLARDLRRLVRQHITAGESDPQIIAWMVARYGDFVLLRPPVSWLTAVLWASPVLAILIGLGVVVLARRPRPAPPPLNEAEQKRLQALLKP